MIMYGNKFSSLMNLLISPARNFTGGSSLSLSTLTQTSQSIQSQDQALSRDLGSTPLSFVYPEHGCCPSDYREDHGSTKQTICCLSVELSPA